MGAILYKDKVYGGGGGGGGGGSTVTITPTLSTGTKIADFEIDGTAGELYAPQGGGGGINYSTQEQVIGTWIDGTPVYQITYVYSSGINFVNATAATLPQTGLPTGWLDSIRFFLDCFASREQSSTRGTGAFPMGAWRDGSTLKVYAAQSWNGMTHFTFRYVKTTD